MKTLQTTHKSKSFRLSSLGSLFLLLALTLLMFPFPWIDSSSRVFSSKFYFFSEGKLYFSIFFIIESIVHRDCLQEKEKERRRRVNFISEMSCCLLSTCWLWLFIDSHIWSLLLWCMNCHKEQYLISQGNTTKKNT